MSELVRPKDPEGLAISLERAKAYIAACRDVDALKDLRDKAEAIKKYERARGASLDAQNDAAEIVVRCDRKLGKLKLEMPKAEGTRGQLRGDVPKGTRVGCDKTSHPTEPKDSPARTRARAEDSRQQRLAKIPASAFEAHVAAVRQKGERLTVSGALAVAARQAERRARVDAIERGNVAVLPTERKYVVVYADPPWQYGDARSGLADYAQSAAAHQYPTMPVGDICALPVRELAARDSVLFCWATFPLLREGLRVVEAWGFAYKQAFVWDKRRANLGNYHNACAEILLVGTRGSCVPEVSKRESQIISLERGAHSEKPDLFREMIDRLYPSGPRIELFRRGAAPTGWDVWGNQAVAA